MARHKNQYFLDFDAYPSKRIGFWHWVIGVILIFVVLVIGTFFVFPIFILFPIDWQLDLNPNFPRSGYAEAVLLWVSFIPAFIAPFLIYKYWQSLPFKRLLTAHQKFDLKRLFISILFVLVAYSVISFIEYKLDPSEFDEVVLHKDWSGFTLLAIITILLLPIQSASEEILCRGYLNQGLSLITRQPWIAFVLTSTFFALLHLANPEAEGQVWPYMIDTFIFGMAMCWLSYEDQGLESAIGVHIGNNLFVFLILGYADPSLPQSAIFMAPEPVIDWKDTVESAVYILGLTFLIIRFNKWRDKRPKLLQANA